MRYGKEAIIQAYSSISNLLDNLNLSKSKNYWISDQSCQCCFECSSPFTSTKRKSHCRLCYWVFCHSCCHVRHSDKGIPIDYQYVKLCTYCFNMLETKFSAKSRNKKEYTINSENIMLDDPQQKNLKQYIDHICQILCGYYLLDNQWASLLANYASTIGQMLRLTNYYGYSLNITKRIRIEITSKGTINDSKLIKGVAFAADLLSTLHTNQMYKPKILIIKSLMCPDRIKRLQKDNCLKQQQEYTDKCIKRILEYDPNIIIFGSYISRAIVQEFVSCKIVVISNLKDDMMIAISQSTGANIVTSPEELPFSQLGSCRQLIIEKPKNKLRAFIIFDDCPYPTFFSLILRGANSSCSPKLREIAQYACFTSFYTILEYNFYTNIFQEIDFIGIKLSNNSFNIRNMDNFLISEVPYYSHSPPLTPYHTDTSTAQSSPKTDISNIKLDKNIKYTPSRFSKLFFSMNTLEISDTLAIFRSTGTFDYVGNDLTQNRQYNTTQNSYNPENIGRSCDAAYVTENFFKFDYFKTVTKVHYNRYEIYLLYKYSINKNKISLCSNPRLMKIYFNHDNDMMLCDFLKSIVDDSTKCNGPNCEYEPVDHVYRFVHNDKFIVLSFFRTAMNQLDSDSANIKILISCNQCKKKFEKYSSGQISFSLFLHNLVYSIPIFSCKNCNENEDSIKLTLSDFNYGFQLPRTFCVFKARKINPYAIYLGDIRCLKPNHTQKIHNLKKLSALFENSKKRSIDVIISQIRIQNEKLKDDKPLYVQNFENSMNLISQSCTDKLWEINTLINGLNKGSLNWETYEEIEHMLSLLMAYIFVNFNYIFLIIKKNKRLVKYLNIQRDADFSKYRAVVEISFHSHFDLFPERGNTLTQISHDKPKILLVKDFIDTRLINKDEEIYVFLQKVEPPRPFILETIPYNAGILSPDSYQSLEAEPNGEERSNSDIEEEQYSLMFHVLKCEEQFKTIKIKDILPFSIDFHIIQYEKKLLTFISSLPASIIAILIKIAETESNMTKLDDIQKKPDSMVGEVRDHQDVNPAMTYVNTCEHISSYFDTKMDGLSSVKERTDKDAETEELTRYDDQDMIIEFSENEYRYSCCIYRHKYFKLLRKYAYGFENDFIYSDILEESDVWNAQGGKSDSTFYKTKDDFFVIKQIPQVEAKCFEEFIDNYLEYMLQNYVHNIKTSLCPIIGMYKITSVVGSSIKSQNYYIVMENIFFDFKMDRMYDIKGCARKNLKVSDENIFEDSYIIQNLCRDPIFVHHKSLADLHVILRRDTKFLEENSVVDYSIIVGVNFKDLQLKMKIVDYLRKYTWDKRLENALKSRILIATSSGRMPTIVSPVEYRIRFMDAIKLYFFPAPGTWDYLEIMKNFSKSEIYFINSLETEKHHPYKCNKATNIKEAITKNRIVL